MGGYKEFTRKELYDLAWSTPMTKLAKQFGLSDVGLRKICAKHRIPTPPLGYWAKLQYGKKVKQTPLPPTANGERDRVQVSVSSAREMPEAVVTAELKAQESLQAKIVVPDVLPNKLHRVAASTKRILKAASRNDETFIEAAGTPGAIHTLIGPSNIERVIALIETIAVTLEDRGHQVVDTDKGADIIVDGERMALSIHETKDKATHQPTKTELAAKARWEADRIRMPSLYSNEREHWRRWDYSPSGRLCVVLENPAAYSWRPEHALGRWYDRKTTRVEDHLNDIIVRMHSGAALVRYNRLAAEEAEQRRQQAAERLRRMQERKERAAKRQAFIEQKAEEYERLRKFEAFGQHLAAQAGGSEAAAIAAIRRAAQETIDRLSRALSAAVLGQEISRLDLYRPEDGETADSQT